MTETERPWYQDGWLVFGIVFGLVPFTVLVGYAIRREHLPRVTPRVSGEVRHSLLSEPELELSVWHQYPGPLQSGRLIMTVEQSTEDGRAKPIIEIHSFESWQPNKQNAVQLRIPPNQFTPDREMSMTFYLEARNMKPTQVDGVWFGTGWKSKAE